MNRVLLVQDGGPTPAVLSALARYGYRTVVAGGALAATEIVANTELRAVVTSYRLSGRSGVWLLAQLQSLQPQAMRVLCVDDPRLDVERLVANGICHGTVIHPIVPARLIDVLAGVPQNSAEERTPIVSLPR